MIVEWFDATDDGVGCAGGCVKLRLGGVARFCVFVPVGLQLMSIRAVERGNVSGDTLTLPPGMVVKDVELPNVGL